MERIDCVLKKGYRLVPKQFKVAFFSAILLGLVAHMYMFTNKLPNMDDLVGVNNFGVTFKNGRWFLWIVGAILYHIDFVYSMPWLNGLITIALLACSAGMIAVLLDMKSLVANAILGSSLVVFPSWTATLFYMFTAPYYALAVLMSVTSVFLVVKLKKGYAISVVLLACSMGIYQAYLPFTATLYVVLLFLMLYEEDKNFVDIIKRAFFYLANLVAGVIVYYILMKISLLLTNQSLNSYKGLDSMGQFSLSRIPEIMNHIFVDFFGVFLNNNLEISYNLITKGMYFVLFVVVFWLVIQLVIVLCKKKDYMKAIEAIVLLLVYIVAINSIYIMCAEGIYSLMYFSYVFMMIFPLTLMDRHFIYSGVNKRNCMMEWGVSFVLVCGIVSYCQYASAEYLSIHLCFEQAKSYFTTMITQIKSTDGYTDETKIAFVGKDIQDKSLYRNDVMRKFEMSGRDKTLVEAYSRQYFLEYYCGFTAEYTSVEGIEEDKIKNMPCYPDAGSIQMIDDIVVVKFSE